MKANNTVKLFTALALTGALSIGTASAMGLNIGTKPITSITGVSSTNISVRVDDGVATLFGSADSQSEVSLAKNHVKTIDGVDRVINLVTFN